MDLQIIQQYTEVLHEELVLSLGCTEPASIAYAAALARATLGFMPESIHVACSGNIIKNVKTVIVPNSGNQKGVEAAAILGTLSGNHEKKLEVLEDITEEDINTSRELYKANFCTVELLKDVPDLHIIITAKGGGHVVLVELAKGHTNVTRLEKDNIPLQTQAQEIVEESYQDRSFMTVKGILEFAEVCSIETVKEILDRQIDCNTHIAEEGFNGTYGANVGRNLILSRGNDFRTRAKASAAAGSDARMSGCKLPVVINSGSGNQGMTVSLPVIEYAKELHVSQDKLYRALIISNLIAIHQKTRIGKLSAYCGAVSAACGSGAAITWLCDGDYKQISDTITNTLANVSGIVCDGAKPSCAAKIASSVDAAILGHDLAMQSKSFHCGDGIVKSDVETTIDSIGRLARVGMRSTDTEVLQIMLEKNQIGEMPKVV